MKFKEAELKAKSRGFQPPAATARISGFPAKPTSKPPNLKQKAPNTICTDGKRWSKAATRKSIASKFKWTRPALRAPFSGVVVRRYIREGQAVAKNDKCFRISQLAPLQVQFQVAGIFRPSVPSVGAPVASLACRQIPAVAFSPRGEGQPHRRPRERQLRRHRAAYRHRNFRFASRHGRARMLIWPGAPATRANPSSETA